MNRWADLIGPVVIPRSRRRKAVVLAIAGVLFAAILIARLQNSDEGNAILGLQVVPITLVAIQLGLLPALWFAVAAMGSTVLWAVTKDVHISALEYLFRAAVFFPTAIMVGWSAGRLHLAYQTVDIREQRLRTVVDSSTDALVTMDADGRILAWNPVAERMFGWRAEETMGKDLAELTMPPQIRELYREGKRRFLEDDDWSMIGRRFESRALAREGREFPIEIAISAVRESGEWIFHVFGHDITERKTQEEERNRLVSIIESTGDAIVSFTLDGQITSWNPGAEQVYGYSAREALRMSMFDFVPPDKPDDVGPLLARLREGKRFENAEFDRVGKGGRLVEVAVTVTPITNASGRIVAGAAIHRDISERRRRERYLTAQHGATRLLSHVPDLEEVGPAILPVIGSAGSWLCAAYWEAFEGGLQCTSTWTTPTTRLPVSPAEEGTEMKQREGQLEVIWAVDGGVSDDVPSGQRAALGGLRTQLWVPTVVSGELFGAFQFFDRRRVERDEELIGTLKAITDQIGNYVRRRRAEEAVERAKDEFFGLVSHELRTPLTSIIGYGELLAESEADRLTEQGRKHLSVIRRNAQREMRLVGDLLLLVRIQEGSFRMELEEVDLRRIVEQAVEAARPAAGKRSIELRAQAGSSPECSGDPQRLGQVVDNLLSNAIKFTPKGGHVAVNLTSNDDTAAIEVKDSGMGIPEEEQKHLFDRLYRSPSATASAIPGVGLGLTIVKAIVDAHEGRILVESEPGAGATFRVELPVQQAHDDVEEVPA
ncbi:MAG: PAS domain S-box protein [Solirubrobacterales bacterium]